MVDQAIVGIWTTDTGMKVEVAADGEFFALDDALPYTISTDGTVLTFPGTNPLWVFTRIWGPAALITGLWQRFEPDGTGGTYREDVALDFLREIQ